MPLPRPSSPRALWADLRAFAAERSRHQWIAALLAITIPVGIVTVFQIDARTNIQPRAQIYYVDSWSATRTDAEIIAEQKADQIRREKAMKERQRQWQKVDQDLKRLGI
ncbi:hypothetical protein [Sphingosinicella rhizophila]|uniref:Uncharacterized protein n=1 Tax=Sphingosinicella rhizophila TaxID=3050082 RepID=A0ABU3Q862_9SPHN|nr:hypothetical protein [Sphingosinicella sp. GR2756]MDT9599517.1 hypothetical protein [Sphingosinicella sp. GR2756]